MLMSAIVNFFLRFGRPANSHVIPPPAPPPSRTTTPVFLSGALCEVVHDGDTGHEFTLCMDDVPDDAFSCRRAEKGGRWVYYCQTDDCPADDGPADDANEERATE
jgi:hypothetical protein